MKYLETFIDPRHYTSPSSWRKISTDPTISLILGHFWPILSLTMVDQSKMSLLIMDLPMFGTKSIGLHVLLISINKRAMITSDIMACFLILLLGNSMTFVQNSYMKISVEKIFQWHTIGRYFLICLMIVVTSVDTSTKDLYL